MAVTHSSCILDPHTRERALLRVGYYLHTAKRGRQVDHRRILDWFLTFSRTNLADLSPPELRIRYDEIRAVQETESGGVRYSEDEATTAAHAPRTQATIATYFDQLRKTGKIAFEDFTLCTSIELPRFRFGPGSNIPYNIIVGEHVDPGPGTGKGLFYQFFLALKGAGDRLRTCAHCATLFVQARRKQQFCVPGCRMRALRAKRHRDAHTKKGGKSHGPKKHR